MQKITSIIDSNNCFITLGQGLWSDSRSKFVVTDKHAMSKILLNFVAKVYRNSGHVILAVDDGTWRKQYYPYYKARRAMQKQTSDFPYEAFVECMENALDVIRNNTKGVDVVKIRGVEGDDIIGCLSPVFAPCNIHSTDQDLLQIQGHFPELTIKQFSPKDGKEITPVSKNYDIIDHIIRGDAGDDIPNVLSDDKCFVDKVRQVPMIKARYEELYAKFSDANFDLESLEDVLKSRYIRNRLMVDLRYIPNEIVDKIFSVYGAISETPRTQTLFENLTKIGILL